MNLPEERERALVEAALKLPPKERAVWLDQQCAGDTGLRRLVVQEIFRQRGGDGSTCQPSSSTDEQTELRSFPPEPGERPGDIIGRYRLLDKLGEGGMGSVWVAEQTEPLRRQVAFKVVKLGMDTRQVIARFQAERQALALMDHPNIAKVLDAGATDKGRPFFVMELVRGVKITEYCDRHNVSTHERLALFTTICHAVEHAHQKAVIHRDLKPGNLLVSLVDGRPSPKVIDFGIAKAIAGQRLADQTVFTTFGEFIGTPAYMSPEQAEMDPLGIDARSDVYSLGVVLYELLVGLTPFDAVRLSQLPPEAIRRIVREEEPLPPSTKLTRLDAQTRAALAKQRQCRPPNLVHLLRGDLDWIVMKCLEKDRTRRYHSALALAQDIQRHLDHQPILARAPSPIYRFRKFVHRHPATLTSAIAILLLAGLIALLWSGGLFHQPLNPAQLLARAQKRLEHYDYEGAIPAALADLREAARLDPGDVRIQATLGWAFWVAYEEDQREETRAEAARASERAIELNHENFQGHLVQGLVASSLRDLSTATNQLLKANDLTRSADPLVLVCLANACRQANDLASANAFADLAEQNAGHDWDALGRLGSFRIRANSLANKASLQRALKDFQAAVLYAPHSPLSHRLLGQALLLSKDAAGADLEFKKSIQLRRTPRSLAAIGSEYLSANNYEAATNYFLQAIEADPAQYTYRINAGLALLNLPGQTNAALEQFSLALRQTQNALAGGKEEPLIRARQGLCRAALKQEQEARKDLDRAQKEAPADAQTLRVLRVAYIFLDDSNKIAELDRLRSRK